MEDDEAKREPGASKAQLLCGCVKTVLFVSALIATVTLFSMPIVLYYIAFYGSPSPAPTATDNMTASCVSELQRGISSVNVSDTELKQTTCELYNGTICLQHLTKWQECLLPPTENEEVSIFFSNHSTQQEVIDEEIMQLQNFLMSNVSDGDCPDLVISFLCLYHFPLMADCLPSSLIYHTVSKEYCDKITMNTCSDSWQMAVDSGYLNEFPNCFSLPEANINTVSNITCRDDFILINDSTCNPNCHVFESHTPNAVRLKTVSEVVAAVFVIIICICIFILSIYNKTVFHFPTFFLLFFVLDLFICALIVLIVATARTTLQCSTPDLLEAFTHPTIFCSITGAIFHYAYVDLGVWWFMHLCVFFYKTMFPFHASRMKPKDNNRLAVILIILGILIPLPGVIAALSSKENQYNIQTTPPSYCLPGLPILFYSIIVIQTVILGGGICILITIFWRIHRHQSKNAKRTNKKQTLTTAEKKIILASSCYAVFGSFVLIFSAFASGRVGTELDDYYECESNGYIPGQCDRSGFERPIYPEIQALANVSLGFIPIGVLNFILNWEKIGKAIKKRLRRSHKRKLQQSSIKSEYSMNSTLRSNSIASYNPKIRGSSFDTTDTTIISES